MTDTPGSIDQFLRSLQERAKELGCLYRIEELLLHPDDELAKILRGVLEAIPAGWQFPDQCRAAIRYEGADYALPGFQETPWMLTAPLHMQQETVGTITVCYLSEQPAAEDGPFLKDEIRLLETIANRLSHFLHYRQTRQAYREQQAAKTGALPAGKREWEMAIDLLRQTDHQLLHRVIRKMFIRLRSVGLPEAIALQERLIADEGLPADENRPLRKQAFDLSPETTAQIIEIAKKHFSNEEILNWVHKWIQEDRSSFLVTALENPGTTLGEVASAIRRFHQIAREGMELSPSANKEIRVSLIQRFFTDQLEYINIAKEFVDLEDFHALLSRIIFPTGSHGMLGGKSAGMFIASRIIETFAKEHDVLRGIRTPKTWYLASDGLLNFLTHNDLEELVEHKYREIDEIRREYNHIVQVFKHSRLTPEIVQGLSVALDDFEDRPLIVRSSSLLEDRFGSSFSGKYKSLFLANQGTKQQRLEALMDAVAEVYSSTFGPDPIQYRAERGLLDFREEMGIMIQEVVGARIGRYFFPAYAGVAFSNNEFRWSPRIRREDGLLRLVPGLGTRAVDRLSDDYPILIAPGQPGLRVNVTVDKVTRYSPRQMDVINLETNSFETVDVRDVLREYGTEIPWLNQMISLCSGGHLRTPSGLTPDLNEDDFCVTFEGLITRTPFIRQMQLVLRLLQDKLGTPVDLEFASDGVHFYLLQCRPQAYATGNVPAPIPRDFPPDQVVFTANRFVSNGRLPDVTHIVYVDPSKYGEISNLDTLREVGRCVGRLNAILPKRRFILMGPGRWGSRGDIKLGVNVSYSEIKNTCMLVEIARKLGNYVPDLSFGTHFFQDLVESSIRYLPLYPDDEGILFNERFLTESPSLLPELLSEFASLADVVRVIDVPACTDGRVLRVLMNADLDRAIGLLSLPTAQVEEMGEVTPPVFDTSSEDHWRWRNRMIERMAEQMSPGRFGVKRLFVIGSTQSATADASSDIDLVVHFAGTDEQRQLLLSWFDGWSLCLAEVNHQRTGVRLPRMLDARLVSDQEFEEMSDEFAATAREIPLRFDTDDTIPAA
ncbi:MAG: PEP/pyruvate-binding domain-containing protein [bacterium]|nr:PEP/pyruvate-binding domain-containing protein [bacterium]